jgi:hypothetical protein
MIRSSSALIRSSTAGSVVDGIAALCWLDAGSDKAQTSKQDKKIMFFIEYSFVSGRQSAYTLPSLRVGLG